MEAEQSCDSPFEVAQMPLLVVLLVFLSYSRSLPPRQRLPGDRGSPCHGGCLRRSARSARSA